MFTTRIVILCGFLGGVVLQAEAPAGMPFSSLCRTPQGVCEAPPAPVGSQCSCGRDRGQMILPPPNASNTCGTSHGVCRSSYAPIGASCMCGTVPGRMIQFR